MPCSFEYSNEKNALLQEIRGVGFEDVITAINNGNLLDDINHFNQKKYPLQKILIVKIGKYVYAVPYAWDRKRNVKFLKTIYPNRVLTKKYLS